MQAAPRRRLSAIRLRWGWVVALGLAAALIWLGLRGLPDGKLHVYFLDVGQGDAILIVTADGRQVLVDGGPSPAVLLSELGQILPFWDRSLDLVVLTHDDQDHVTGLYEVLSRYKVGQVLESAASDGHESASGRAWQAALTGSQAGRVLAVRGTEVRIGELRLRVLHPPGFAKEDGSSRDNDFSVVLRADYGETCVMLTGDAESVSEGLMTDADLIQPCNILKVAHHGSNDATSQDFLAKLRPQLGVIQVGADNRFGHPHPEVLKRIQSVCAVLRTDIHGRIEAISDGRRWTIRVARNRSGAAAALQQGEQAAAKVSPTASR